MLQNFRAAHWFSFWISIYIIFDRRFFFRAEVVGKIQKNASVSLVLRESFSLCFCAPYSDITIVRVRCHLTVVLLATRITVPIPNCPSQAILKSTAHRKSCNENIRQTSHRESPSTLSQQVVSGRRSQSTTRPFFEDLSANEIASPSSQNTTTAVPYLV